MLAIRHTNTLALDTKTQAWLARALKQGLLDGAVQEFVETELGVQKPQPRHDFEAQWERNLAACKEFVLDTGRTPSQKASTPEEKRLGIWLSSQASSYTRGELGEERIQSLMAAHPLLASRVDGTGTQEALWERNLAACKEFVLDTGRTPSTTASTPEEKRLGSWLSKQASRSNRGDLEDEKIQSLMAAHPLLASRVDGIRGREGLWERNLAACKEFVLDTGRTPTETASTPEEKRLGKWLRNQARSYTRDDLEGEKIQSLMVAHPLLASRVDGSGGLEAVWARSLAACKEFVLDTGRTPSKTASTPEEKRLGSWLSYQARSYTRGSLEEERVQGLMAAHPLLASRVDGTGTQEAVWERNLTACKEFVLDTGRTPSTTASTPEEKRLGIWLKGQAPGKNRGSRSAERKERLKEAHPLIRLRVFKEQPF